MGPKREERRAGLRACSLCTAPARCVKVSGEVGDSDAGHLNLFCRQRQTKHVHRELGLGMALYWNPEIMF